MTDNTTNASDALTPLLQACLGLEASDLHLVIGSPPTLRIQGTLVPLADEAAIDDAAMQALAAPLLALTPRDWTKGSIDGAMTGPSGARFRFNVFRRQGGLSIALRRLEDRFRPLEELGLPPSLYSFCDLRDGLVAVCGPTGAGKSTTLATLVDRINQTRACHIVTIEDPIEYVHRSAKGLVNQRQVGLDAPSFNDALVASLRQDPDVILVGEIRDLATIRTAITAAETGHLVFTTLHAGDCVGAIERLVSVFPEGEQDGVRRQLALALRAVVAQHLLPACGWHGHAPLRDHERPADGNMATQKRVAMPPGASADRTRVPASEILVVTPAVANLIGAGRSAQIYSLMESGQAAGMQTLEQDLARLWMSGAISEQAALARARNPQVLRDRVALAARRTSGADGGGGRKGATS
jgi:twitching motility protein PilT